MRWIRTAEEGPAAQPKRSALGQEVRPAGLLSPTGLPHAGPAVVEGCKTVG